jgi:hypothetical protein
MPRPMEKGMMMTFTIATLILFIASFVLTLLDAERRERRGDYLSVVHPLMMIVTVMFFFMLVLSIVRGVG